MTMLSSVFNCSTFFTLVLLGWLYLAANNLYRLMNPLSELSEDLLNDQTIPRLNPLWAEGESFNLVAFLSHSPKFVPFKISALRAKKQLLIERKGIRFVSTDEELKIAFQITNKEPANKNNEDIVEETVSSDENHFEKRVIPSPKIWKNIQTNGSDVFLHVFILNNEKILGNSKNHPKGNNEREEMEIEIDDINSTVSKSGAALYGIIRMIKYDVIPRHFRHRYLLSDFNLVDVSTLDSQRARMDPSTVISYWKPEVSVKLVTDFTSYPVEHVPMAIEPHIVRSGSSRRPSYKPPIHADEIGLTSDKYIALNSSVNELPLTLSYGSMSLQRWMLMSNMEQSISAQQGLGFSAKDMDDVRRLISDTSVYLLGVTMLASVLHLLFEALAFQSDISFWQNNKSLAGLSTRSVLTDLFSQIIVFLFLVDSDTSLLVTIPAFIGIIIQIWKVNKATGLQLRRSKNGWPELCFSRWEKETAVDIDTSGERSDLQEKEDVGSKTESIDVASNNESPKDDVRKQNVSEKDLAQLTLEADRTATLYLGTLLAPLTLGFAARTLLYDKHSGWYSWFIGALTTCVYTFGFILMCPQLFINHKLKSVSHLPWKFLVYRFLNTFIDDLFAFIIKMPAMHRLSVFRDDIVFLIYMYQRWIYRVDESRPIEK